MGWQFLNFEEVQGAFSRTATSSYGFFCPAFKGIVESRLPGKVQNNGTGWGSDEAASAQLEHRLSSVEKYFNCDTIKGHEMKRANAIMCKVYSV